MQSARSPSTTRILLITTLAGLDIAISLVKQRVPQRDRIIGGVPTVIVHNGKLLKDRMDKARVDESDVLDAARKLQGLERLDQVYRAGAGRADYRRVPAAR